LVVSPGRTLFALLRKGNDVLARFFGERVGKVFLNAAISSARADFGLRGRGAWIAEVSA
jgi:hypothetical protein